MKRQTGPLPQFNEDARQRVRMGFLERGESIANWARMHDFAPDAVYQVLSGRTLAIRGTSHHIAVALGLKASSTTTSGIARKQALKENDM